MFNFLNLAIIAPPILLALTVHEYAHGYIAYRLGDDTAKRAGRLTLNPLSHLDPIGTLMLFIIHIGWAKPVPVNPYNLKNPPRDLIWVSLAGPAANLFVASLAGLLLRFFSFSGFHPGEILTMMVMYTVLINLVLAFFNLIPIPPLDGSKILAGLLKGKAAYAFARFEQYAPFFFIALIIGGHLLNIPIIWWVIAPFVRYFSLLFAGVDLSAY